MRNLIAEYGLVLISAIFVAAVFACIFPMFQDGGLIREGIMNYISYIC